eukprot:TRINITY_DN1778_c0_g2_i2.p1 TRINITY_DN1778_c0_g2~~TRINITY_DN1778_c0_g2_i2.p1  ORF type:complete len:187 (+),score=37.89 TRINITY_DN1778_c0_g2_i2:284-844(+)
MGTLENIKVKILVNGDGTRYSQIRFELTSETDLFFHYIATIDELKFKRMRDEQKLSIDYQNLITLLIKLCNNCSKDPHAYIGVLYLEREGASHLDFIQNMEYKFVELLSVHFAAANEEVVRQSIAFRYNSVKAKMLLMQNRMAEIISIIKLKNPSLLLQIQKNSNPNMSVLGRTSQQSLNNSKLGR